MSYTSETSGIIDHAFLKNFYNGFQGRGVLSGMALSVTGSSLVITIASGKIKSATGITNYPGGTVTCSAGHATLPRMDAIIWDDSASTVVILAGTATAEAATQSRPPLTDLSDANDLLLGMAYITATATTIPSGNLFQRQILIGSSTESIVKTTDEPLSNNATLQNDDELLAPVAINKSYTFSGLILYTAGATGQFKFAFSWPTGTFGTIMYDYINTSNTPTQGGDSSSASAFNGYGPGVTSPRLVRYYGGLLTGSTAGNLQFQWAQYASNGTATTVKAGSSLTVLSAI